jgi:hypothetical protein
MRLISRSLSTGRRKVAEAAACIAAHKTRRVSRRISARRDMPAGQFALPASRRYPIHDEYHATLALSHLLRTVGRTGPQPVEAKQVLSAVRRRWPGVYACEADLVKKVKRTHKLLR